MDGFDHYAVQAALHAALEADAPLMGTVTGVFDFVPPQTAFPYVTLGEMRVTDVSTVECTLRQVEPVLHVYSRSKGRREVSDIMEKLHARLHNGALPIAGYTLVSLRFAGSDIVQERDGNTYHGRMRFSAVVQKD